MRCLISLFNTRVQNELNVSLSVSVRASRPHISYSIAPSARVQQPRLKRHFQAMYKPHLSRVGHYALLIRKAKNYHISVCQINVSIFGLSFRLTMYDDGTYKCAANDAYRIRYEAFDV